MLNVLLASFLSVSLTQCPPTKITGRDKWGWNANDQKILNRAKKRCGELYPGSPCVKQFNKIGPNDYSVICGAQVKSDVLPEDLNYLLK